MKHQGRGIGAKRSLNPSTGDCTVDNGQSGASHPRRDGSRWSLMHHAQSQFLASPIATAPPHAFVPASRTSPVFAESARRISLSLVRCLQLSTVRDGVSAVPRLDGTWKVSKRRGEERRSKARRDRACPEHTIGEGLGERFELLVVQTVEIRCVFVAQLLLSTTTSATVPPILTTRRGESPVLDVHWQGQTHRQEDVPYNTAQMLLCAPHGRVSLVDRRHVLGQPVRHGREEIPDGEIVTTPSIGGECLQHCQTGEDWSYGRRDTRLLLLEEWLEELHVWRFGVDVHHPLKADV